MVDKPHPWQLLNRAHFSEAKEKFFIGDVVASYPESDVFCYALNGKRISILVEKVFGIVVRIPDPTKNRGSEN